MASSVKKSKIAHQSKQFSCGENEMLIELVAQNPGLYDVKLQTYKDALKRERIWKDIGSALHKTSTDCKKRWKYIKDSYNRYKRKRKADRRSAALPKTSMWEFYERLHFLELSSSPKEAISNIPGHSQNEYMEIVEDNDSDNSDDVDADTDTQSTIVNEPEDERNAPKENSNNKEQVKQQHNIHTTDKAVPKKRRQNEQDEKERDVQGQALLNQICEENVETNIDEDVNSFGDYIKAVLKKLPPILKVKAKAEVFNTLSKYELISMETPDPTPS